MVISKFLGKTVASKIRSKAKKAAKRVDKGIENFNKGYTKQKALDERYPGWQRRGTYKRSELWFLKNAVKAANRDGFNTRSVPAVNGYGEEVRVLFIKRAARGTGRHYTTKR